jgi:hypothetical protein
MRDSGDGGHLMLLWLYAAESPGRRIRGGLRRDTHITSQ